MCKKKYTTDFTPVTGHIRVFEGEKNYADGDDYISIVTVQFLTKTKVYLSGAKGKLRDKIDNKIRKQLKAIGVEQIRYVNKGLEIEEYL